MMTARDTEEEDDQAAGCVRDREDAKGGVYSVRHLVNMILGKLHHLSSVRPSRF